MSVPLPFSTFMENPIILLPAVCSFGFILTYLSISILFFHLPSILLPNNNKLFIFTGSYISVSFQPWSINLKYLDKKIDSEHKTWLLLEDNRVLNSCLIKSKLVQFGKLLFWSYRRDCFIILIYCFNFQICDWSVMGFFFWLLIGCVYF